MKQLPEKNVTLLFIVNATFYGQKQFTRRITKQTILPLYDLYIHKCRE